MAQQPTVRHNLLIIQASRLHSDTPHSVGLLWTSDQSDAERPLPDKTQHSHGTDIHVPDEIRARNPSKPAAAGPRLRPGGQWDQPYKTYTHD